MALHNEEKAKIIKDFAVTEQDTGSAEVQIALLTNNIAKLNEHCKKNKHDYSSKRGLLKMVCQRRKLLRYLEKSNINKYKQIIERLGLRK